MKTSTITFPSHDGTSTIHALLWERGEDGGERARGVQASDDLGEDERGDQAPGEDERSEQKSGEDGGDERGEQGGDERPKVRGIVQIVHGMCEHVERYTEFAEYLVNRGFVVCAGDHIGHGKTAATPDDLGHMPLEGGEDILVEDVHELRRIVQERFPGVPYVVLGHSMGSFIVRVYLTRHAAGVRAAILFGTGQPGVLWTRAGSLVLAALAALHGERYRSRLAQALGLGMYERSVPESRTPFDWIACDPAVVDAFVDDPLCGQTFTVGAYTTLARLVEDATDARLAREVPHTLPLFFASGELDPVGEQGRGVRRAVGEYRNAGLVHVELALYPSVRHEILHERCRDKVCADVLGFLERQGL